MEPIIVDLSGVVTLKDDELFRLCAANRNVRIERTSKGELVFMSPSGGETSARNTTILVALGNWNEQTGLGVVFDSSGGFLLPNRAMRAPDAAWVALDRWNGLTPEARKKFLPFCPDFLVELMSETDRLAPAQEKMQEWMENGCRLAWLIDPAREQAFVYRAGRDMRRVSSFEDVLSGEDVLPGFTLALHRLR